MNDKIDQDNPYWAIMNTISESMQATIEMELSVREQLASLKEHVRTMRQKERQKEIEAIVSKEVQNSGIYDKLSAIENEICGLGSEVHGLKKSIGDLEKTVDRLCAQYAKKN